MSGLSPSSSQQAQPSTAKMSGFYRSIGFLIIAVFANVGDALPPQRIIGGVAAVPGEFPYQVALRFNKRHVCGGSIISQRHVITAAHCVHSIRKNLYANFKVMTGTTFSYGGQPHAIRSIVCHPKYNKSSSTSPDDIAIIELATDVAFGRFQNRIQLPSQRVKSGVAVITTGWGVESTNQTSDTNRLMKTTLRTLDIAQCQRHFSKIVLSPHQICTYDGIYHGVCHGDSGGPLVYNNTLVGIVSYGIPCGIGYPDVWTNVYYYLDWIKATIAKALVLRI